MAWELVLLSQNISSWSYWAWHYWCCTSLQCGVIYNYYLIRQRIHSTKSSLITYWHPLKSHKKIQFVWARHLRNTEIYMAWDISLELNECWLISLCHEDFWVYLALRQDIVLKFQEMMSNMSLDTCKKLQIYCEPFDIYIPHWPYWFWHTQKYSIIMADPVAKQYLKPYLQIIRSSAYLLQVIRR